MVFSGRTASFFSRAQKWVYRKFNFKSGPYFSEADMKGIYIAGGVAIIVGGILGIVFLLIFR